MIFSFALIKLMQKLMLVMLSICLIHDNPLFPMLDIVHAYLNQSLQTVLEVWSGLKVFTCSSSAVC